MRDILKPVAPNLTVKGDPLPITGISCKGQIHPVFAVLELTQEFINGDDLADVTYHAPIHPDWAVRKVTMTCDERTIRTVVLPKQKAQETFNQAKEDGHTAVLAQETAPDEMQLQLANVPAKAKVTVTSEIVAWPMVEKNRGSLIIPLINGPKYGNPEIQQSYFDVDDVDKRHSSVDLDIDLFVKNPKVDVGTIKPVVTSDKAPKMVDGIQMMRLREEIAPVGQITIEFDARPTALYFEEEGKKYLVVGVPAVRPDDAPEWGRTAMLVDRSGSMSGLGIQSAVQVAQSVQKRIGENITAAYMFDDKISKVWPKGLNDKGLNAADAIAAHGCPGGATHTRKAMEHVSKNEKGKLDNIILVTDGLVADETLCRVANDIAKTGIAVHTVLVGTAPSQAVGEVISLAGGGFFMNLGSGKADQERIDDGIERFLLGGATLESITIDGKTIESKIPVRGRPLMIPVEVDSKPKNISVRMDGVSIPVSVLEKEEAEFIWARAAVMGIVRQAMVDGTYDGRDMSWAAPELKNAIEKIGVEHQIMTPLTSFVGLDASETFDRSTVKEILAQMSLPEGIDAGGFYGLPKGGDLNLSTSYLTGTTAIPPGFYSPYHTPQRFASAGPVRGMSMLYSMSARKIGDYKDENITTRTNWTDGSTRASYLGNTFEPVDVATSMPNIYNFYSEGVIDNRGDDQLFELYSEVEDEMTDGLGLSKKILSGSSSFILDASPEEVFTLQDEAATILDTLVYKLRTDPEDPFADGWLLEFSRNAIVYAGTILSSLNANIKWILIAMMKIAAQAPEVGTATILAVAEAIPELCQMLEKTLEEIPEKHGS